MSEVARQNHPSKKWLKNGFWSEKFWGSTNRRQSSQAQFGSRKFSKRTMSWRDIANFAISDPWCSVGGETLGAKSRCWVHDIDSLWTCVLYDTWAAHMPKRVVVQIEKLRNFFSVRNSSYPHNFENWHFLQKLTNFHDVVAEIWLCPKNPLTIPLRKLLKNYNWAKKCQKMNFCTISKKGCFLKV